MIFSELQPVHVAALIAGAVFVLVLVTGRIVIDRGAIRRRTIGATAEGRSPHSSAEGHALQFMTRAGKLLAPTSGDALSALRKDLIRAGYFSPAAVPILYASRIVFALALPIIFISSTGMLPFHLPSALLLAITIGLAMLGVILPPIYVDWRQTSMQTLYRHAFPDFMDMIVVCIEAGQSLQGAIERVSREVMQYCPPLGANLHLVHLELRAGRTLTEALDGLSSRLGIDEVQSLRLLLKQSEELGSSIAAALRTFSDEMRHKRLTRAEARALALPAKMTLPLGFFIFPVILLVIMVPLVIRIKNAFV